MSIGAIASGPALGIFTMGILLPWVNSKVSKYYGFLYLYKETCR